MTALGVYQILFFFAVIIALTKPVGAFMARVFEGQRTFLHPLLRPLERAIYRLGGVREEVEQGWTQYAGALLAFSVAKFAFTFAIQRLQGVLPLNPQGFGTSHAPAGATAMTPDLAFSTAVSFMTNTNWQAYGGESTLSYFVQMAALTVQNFTSAAAGIAIAIAVTRGFARREAKTIGNFWVDMTRATVYVLLPLAFVAALVFVSQGVVQNWDPYTKVTTVEGASQTRVTLRLPAANPVRRRILYLRFSSCSSIAWPFSCQVPRSIPRLSIQRSPKRTAASRSTPSAPSRTRCP